jgi:transposase InsO family protein
MEYLKSIKPRYAQASKAGKTAILNEFCRVCGYTRKHAIALLNGDTPPPSEHRPAPRPPTYGPQITDIARFVWEKGGYPWSVRLKKMLKDWLPHIRKKFDLDPRTEALLLAASKNTLDRLLKPYKDKTRKRIYGKTKPGSLLKRDIPVRTDFWDVASPGWLEIDLVSHSGPSAFGDFIYTLNATDIYSGWVESRAVIGKAEETIRAALEEILRALPFPAKGVDSDNGSEFINKHLLRYCRSSKLEFTRSRPYKKDDNAHIEQKNWTHVRKLIGWDRYDSARALDAMNGLYRKPLSLWMNLFQPSVKLVKTVRRGSKTKKYYDEPQTPLDRLAAYDKELARELLKARELINPFDISDEVSGRLERIWPLANHKPKMKVIVKKEDELVKEALGIIERRFKALNRAATEGRAKTASHGTI